jgi:hypothetical protein
MVLMHAAGAVYRDGCQNGGSFHDYEVLGTFFCA